MITLEKGKKILQFEAELYELYVSKIEKVKAVLKSFDGKQVNVRITERLQEEIQRTDCFVSVEKEGSNMRVCFASVSRCIDVGKARSSELFYVDNSKAGILCEGAVKNGRLDYQAAEPQIDKMAADWLNEAKEYKTTDYAKLIAEYKGIVDSIHAFRDSGSYRIKDLLGLGFEIKFTGVC